jgi:hypothetical protein
MELVPSFVERVYVFTGWGAAATRLALCPVCL